jgi:hypothetical protein
MLRVSAAGIEGTEARDAYNEDMQLRGARLCLDCEEIHEAQQCPVCASEVFAYLTRWVPAPERRAVPRSVQSVPPAAARVPKPVKVVGLSLAGLGILGLARWFAKGRKLIEDSALKNPGELK